MRARSIDGLKQLEQLQGALKTLQKQMEQSDRILREKLNDLPPKDRAKYQQMHADLIKAMQEGDSSKVEKIRADFMRTFNTKPNGDDSSKRQ